MRLVMLITGLRFGIYAIVMRRDGFEYCPVEEFMAQMLAPSRKSMLNLLRRQAETGPILNEQKSRLLQDGLFEFKSRQGDRLLYFYHPFQRGRIIITHGFHKGARLRVEIDRANDFRAEYLSGLS